MISRRSRSAALVLAAVLLAGPALSGCSIVSNFLPGGGNGGGLPGGVVPGQSVPDDFPSEVPLIDGDVLLGLSIPGDGEKAWNVTIKVDGIEAFETIKTQLTDAGFEYREVGANETGATGGFSKEPYTVVVVVSSDNDSWAANYTVTDAGMQ
jgi:hypothetical protein